MKMMAGKKPADRYQSMSEVARGIASLERDRGIGSSGSGPGSSVRSELSGSGAFGRNAAAPQAVATTKRRDSGELPRAVIESPVAGPAMSDTVSDYDRSAVPTPSITRRSNAKRRALRFQPPRKGLAQGIAA